MTSPIAENPARPMTESVPAIEALRHVPLFRGLDDPLLESLAVELRTAEFAAGTRVFEEQDASSELYMIQSGKVKVVRSGEAHEVVLAVLGPGDCFGELSLCDGSGRSAAVVALEPTRTYALGREEFGRFLAGHPAAAMDLLRVLATRLRKTSERLSDMVLFDLPVRTARRLMELAEEYGSETEGGTAIRLSLTREELAPLVGATADQVEAELRGLQETGVILWDGASVTVRSPVLLEERARGGLRYVPLGHVTVPRWLLEGQ